MSQLNRKHFLVLVAVFAVLTGMVSRPLCAAKESFPGDVKGFALSIRMSASGEKFYLLTSRNLTIYSLKTQQVITSYSFGVNEKPLRLDILDLDGDGGEDMIVTIVVPPKLRSRIFTIDEDQKIQPLVGDLPYFFRVIRTKEKGALLVGQKSTETNPFAGNVFELKLEGGKIVKKRSLDLPKSTGIYSFANRPDGVWIRDNEGRLKLYKKTGRKWKREFKSTEKYRGNVNCFNFTELEPMSERVKDPVCIPTPPVVISIPNKIESTNHESRITKDEKVNRWEKTTSATQGDLKELIIIDDHKFFLSKVILSPNVPTKAYLFQVAYSEAGELIDCSNSGPYQGWIADYIIDETAPGDKEGRETLVLLRNQALSGGDVKLTDLSISLLDCRGKM